MLERVEIASKLRDRAPAQRSCVERFGARNSIDIHCDCLPCLDDEAGTMLDALALCRVLVEGGITTVIANQLGRYRGRNKAAAVRDATPHFRRGEAHVMDL